mmetsp:Transcript_17193/g.54399  ORF Transcript_17193/g.54399 Transcript_17193/m.54399 type:complete len:379 (+) Transcript_17193:111-1247(+)
MPKAIRTRVYQRHAEHRGVRHRRAVCRETLSLLLREPNGTTTPGVSSTNARTRQQRPDPPRTDSAREAPAHAPAASEGGGRAGGGPLVRLARGPALVCVALPLPVVGHAPVDGHARASPVARPRGGHLLGSLPADRHREEGPVAARPLRPLKQVVAREGGDGEQPLVEVGLQQRRVEPVGAEGPAERGGERVLDVARNLVEAEQEGDRAEGDDHREGEGGDLVHHNHREEAEVDEADEGVELRVREGEGRVHHLEGGVVRQRAVREDLVDARHHGRLRLGEAAYKDLPTTRPSARFSERPPPPRRGRRSFAGGRAASSASQSPRAPAPPRRRAARARRRSRLRARRSDCGRRRRRRLSCGAARRGRRKTGRGCRGAAG